jgi:hypothetical protein
MFDNLSKNLAKNIVENCEVVDDVVYKPHNKNMVGIKLKFPDGTSGMLWSYDKGKKFLFNGKVFGSVIEINLTLNQGDDIWQKFKDHFGPHKYQIKEI